MTSKIKLTNIDFSLEWKSHAATHTDIYHAVDIDLEHDNLPGILAEDISTLDIGSSHIKKFQSQSKELLGVTHSALQVIRFDSKHFNTQFKGQNSKPSLYRFYPSAIASEGLNTSPSNYTPFRLIRNQHEQMTADCNHPLSHFYLNLITTKVAEVEKDIEDRPSKNIAKLITSKGPGMQVPFEFAEPAFFDQYPFINKTDLSKLQTSHIDAKAEEEIVKLHSRLLPKHSKVLDLMSHEKSHLASDYETGLLTGLGANEEALSNNQRLDTYEVHNLNNNSELPFESNSFNDAICTMSIEYLIHPLAVMKEVSRVVNSGGKFIVTFSNNSRSDQTMNLWGQLHAFEKLQLVLEYFRFSGDFIDLHTYSKRGLPRSRDDKYIDKKRLSDPIFAVWGTIK